MDDRTLVDRIELQQEKLKKVSEELKAHFVGLDEVIDRIISNIEAWYCMPDCLTRPTIVCLWGLTGNGKTDLVRRLVAGLDMTDSFVEIQMTNKGSSQHTYNSTLQGLLSSSNVVPEEPGILLLDEMQRFRSVDGDGKEIQDYSFQDLWMLLSDGSFGSASSNKQQIVEMMQEAIYYEDMERVAAENAKEDDKEKAAEKKQSRYRFSVWTARQIQKKLKLSEPIEEIMRWDYTKKIEVIREKIKDKSVFKPEIYKKLLIFVSGNLDEAYTMAKDASETDVDADLFHKHSLRINLLSIKTALGARFKPEQIARFGNTHVIYPSLSRASFEKIIQRKLEDIMERIQNASGVQLAIGRCVHDAIYRNGVFPTQGTRPIFSTISSFFESSLPTFTMRCLKLGRSGGRLFYENKHLCCEIGDEIVRVKNEGDIDKIKDEKWNVDNIRRVAVHEAGHAVLYAVLYGYAPTQVVALAASNDVNGFVGMHAMDTTKDFICKKITTYWGGRVAEELVFGSEHIAGGATGDISMATLFAAQFLRVYGMGERLSYTMPINSASAHHYNTDMSDSNKKIEEILKAYKERAASLMKIHVKLLVELSTYLIDNAKIEASDFIRLCKAHGVEVEELDAKNVIRPSFSKLFERFVGVYSSKNVAESVGLTNLN